MTILDQHDLFFAHHHLSGVAWGHPSRFALEERVAALASAGSTGLGFDIDELEKLTAARGSSHVQSVLAEHGVRIGELEVLIGWWNLDGPAGEAARALEDRAFRLADRYEIPRLKASAVFFPAESRPPLDLLAERFAAVCDRAVEHGLAITLEPVSVFPGFNYVDAATVVREADRPNGGVLIDAWHFFRDPAGFQGLDLLEGRHLLAFELVDGVAEPAVSLMEDSADGRLLPGDGDFDLARLVAAIDAKQPDLHLAVEVLSSSLRELSPADNVKQTVAAVDALRDRIR